jgi:hypothetical protein
MSVVLLEHAIIYKKMVIKYNIGIKIQYLSQC